MMNPIKTALLVLLAAVALPASAQPPPPPLNEEMVKNLILTWYSGTNDHRPVGNLVAMLADDVEMRYPNRAEPFTGKEAFKAWYADVLTKFFDETHHVESCEIKTDGNSATATVVVRWERRTWEAGTAQSVYSASLSRQKFEFARNPSTGSVVIRKKIVETFEPTAPIFGVGN
jgi:hypothetical protein